MPWISDQLPWNITTITKPARPSGVWEPLNYLTGPPVIITVGKIGTPSSGAPVIHGVGLKPYMFPDRTTIASQYNAPVMPSIGRILTAQRLKG